MCDNDDNCIRRFEVDHLGNMGVDESVVVVSVS
jgi:hypothetical protein